MGASAVALGVGVALANGAGVAHAEDSEPSTSASSTDSESDSTTTDTSDTPIDNDDDDDDDAASDSDEAVDESDSDTEPDASDEAVDASDEPSGDDELTDSDDDRDAGSSRDAETGTSSTPSLDDTSQSEPDSSSDADDPLPDVVEAPSVSTVALQTSTEEASSADSNDAVIAIPPQPVGAEVTSVLTVSVVDRTPAAPAAPANPLTDLVWAYFRHIRTTFFNSSPTARPWQNPGQTSLGVVTGDVGESDPDGDPLRVMLTTGPARGTVIVNADGTYTYTPSAALAAAGGTDTFVVTIQETNAGNHIHGLLGLINRLLGRNDGSSITRSVTVTIAGVSTPDNGSPVLGVPAFTVDTVQSTSGAVTGRIHITDPDSDDLTYTLVSPVDTEFGAVVLDAETGTWTFRPTTAARLQAWTTPESRTVAFAVSVTDGTNPAVTVDVTAPVMPAAHFEAANISGAEQESWGNQGLAIGPDGRYYFTTYTVDNTAGEVVVLDADGRYSHTIDLASVVSQPFVSAYDVVIGPDGRVFVSGEVADTWESLQQETGGGVIVVIDPAADDAASVFAETATPLSALAIGADGRVYAANWHDDSILVFASDGSLQQTIGTDILVEDDDSGVAGLALGAEGLLYLTKPQLGVVKVVDTGDDTVSVIDVDGEPWSVAVGANGVLYVTSFGSGSVALIDPNGTTFRTLDLGAGASPSDVTLDADGRVHVAYLTSSGGAIAVITAVAVEADTATAVGPVLSGVAAGAPIVSGGVVYQAVTGIDAATGEPVVTVATTSALGATTVVQIPGEQVGALVLGPGNVVYQTVRVLDQATGTEQTGVLRVAPDGTHVFTELVAGTASGAIVIDGAGNAFQIVDGAAATMVVAVSQDGAVETYAVAGSPDADSTTGGSATTTINGVVYLITLDFGDDDTDSPTTYLSVLGAADGQTFSIDGVASGPPVRTADGAIVQTIARSDVDSDSERVTFTTVVAALTDAGLVEMGEAAPGLPIGGLVAASDGTLFQTVVNVDAEADGTTSEVYTSVLTVGDTGLTTVIERIPGTPVGADGSVIPLVAGADGVVYQTIYGYTDPDTGDTLTVVVALTSAGVDNGAFVAGQPVGAPVVVDGIAYLTTYDATNDRTRIAILAPAAEAEVHEFDGAAASPAVVSPDGMVYQVIVLDDALTGEDVTTVVIATGLDVVSSTRNGTPSWPVVFDSTGAAYLTVSSTDFATQTVYTQVLSVNGDGLMAFGAPLRGTPAGHVVVGADGTVYQAVSDSDGVGSFTTSVFTVQSSASVARVATVSVAAARASGVIDDAWLAPFRAIDPTGRFWYTRYIISQKGDDVNLAPMSDAELVAWVRDNVDPFTVNPADFGRDSQGRITFRNTSNQDILLVYGARPDTYAEGAMIVRPGATGVVPAGPSGRTAGVQRLGEDGWAAIVYRGATPLPTTTPKSAPVTSTNPAQYKLKAEQLIQRLSGMPADRTEVDIVKSGNTVRMVVYVTGIEATAGSVNNFGWVRLGGIIPGHVNDAINDAMKVHENVSEIMLVGHSNGSMIVQNYAKSGKYKDKVTVMVTSGTAVITVPRDGIKVLFLSDPADSLVQNIDNNGDVVTNAGKNRVFVTVTTPFSDKHSFDNYKKIARDFDGATADKWTSTKQAIDRFSGSVIAKNPKPAPTKPFWMWW